MFTSANSMPRVFKSALARSHHGHQLVEYTVTGLIGLENVPVAPRIPAPGPSTTLTAADARLLQDRGGGAALAAIGRGGPHPAPLHARSRARRRGRQGRAPDALARRCAPRAVQPRRARAARGARR